MPIPILRKSYTRTRTRPHPTHCTILLQTTNRKLIILKAIFLLSVFNVLTWISCVFVVSIRKYKMPSFNFISENVAMRRLNGGANRAHEFCSSCSRADALLFVAVVLIQFNNILIFATNHNSTNARAQPFTT